MADKAENEKTSGPAGSERRAALRSDVPGGGSTRLRESGFPMRKASTLPDVSAYAGSTANEQEAPSDASEPHATRTEAATTDPTTPATEQIAATPVAVGHDGTADDDGTHAYAGAATVDDDGRTGPAETSTAGASPAGTSTAGTGAATADDDGRTGPAGTSTAGTGTAAVGSASPAAADSIDRRSSRAQTATDDPAPDTSALTIRPPEEDVNRRANQRDEAAAAKPILPRVLQIAVAVFFPVILLGAAVRAVTTPLFLWVEYHRPGFPADSYGFSTEDRMTYGSYAMDYILNWAPPRYLGDLVHTDGDQLFLDSEVGHMADVKAVLSTGFVVAAVLAVLAILACVYLARRYPGGIRRALFAGAVVTLVLAVALALAGVLAWETFFAQVHALFFADGTWTFRLDDTLIRLFPAQFWIDAAATIGAIVLLGSLLTLVLTWPTRARRERSARAYEARRSAARLQD